MIAGPIDDNTYKCIFCGYVCLIRESHKLRLLSPLHKCPKCGEMMLLDKPSFLSIILDVVDAVTGKKSKRRR